MKTIKNGLIAAAFATLTGCGAPTLENLKGSWHPSEKAALEDLFVDSGKCKSAEVTLSRGGYMILCDNTHFFDYDNNHGLMEDEAELFWGDVVYYDSNDDGNVDWLTTDGNLVDLNNNSRVNGRYQSLLHELERHAVHEVWDYRWR